jgi:hypothetical protein
MQNYDADKENVDNSNQYTITMITKGFLSIVLY